jgi:hypothetical protein
MTFPAVQEFQPILSKSEGRGALPDLVLDLDRVTINGTCTACLQVELKELNAMGLGKNKRTAEMLGWGRRPWFVGAIFGGGRGAAIGAGNGAGGVSDSASKSLASK